MKTFVCSTSCTFFLNVHMGAYMHSCKCICLNNRDESSKTMGRGVKGRGGTEVGGLDVGGGWWGKGWLYRVVEVS